jgi:hypothetical protein
MKYPSVNQVGAAVVDINPLLDQKQLLLHTCTFTCDAIASLLPSLRGITTLGDAESCCLHLAVRVYM